MAAPNTIDPGGSTGDRLATASTVAIANAGYVWYVGNSVVGAADAAATGGALDGGRRREKPLLTTAQAITNAATGDIVVFLSGHAETLSGAVTINKGLTFVSEGTGSSAARFTCAGAIAMFDVTAANVRFRNLYFPASTAVPTARVRIATAGCQVVNCTFECGTNDTARALSFVTGAGNCRVEGSTFRATAATPANAIEVVNAMTGLDLQDVTFDAGAFGWTSYAFQGTAAITSASFMGINLLNGSDLHFATGSSGFVEYTASGGMFVKIDA